ncbi:hypothetical protein DC522_32885 [Microvirga sp. KLBC 81]|uniref:glycosyltransferase n=1 Tax=Microvirga sp. KLBC 81 TaxID=1862707 RepID=UPI000D50A58E|nr:glycosyltransferase [Microvirga sp. KLBC 81]PVE20345.1 hypothetical protein DC522_32885 [Microvirga sp. KLBC 81]
MTIERHLLRISMVFVSYPVPSETFAVRDVRALRGMGHSVETLSLLNGRKFSEILSSLKQFPRAMRRPGALIVIKLGLRIILSGGWTWREKLKCLFLLPSAACVASRVIESRPDIVHLFWGHYPSMVALLAKPFLTQTHFTAFLGAYDLEKRLPITKWTAHLSPVLFTHAYVNRRAIEYFIGRHRIEVIHRGIEIKPYLSGDWKPLQQRALRIFTAGRFIAEKGFDRILRVFERVAALYPEATLAIAGDGPERMNLVAMARELKIEDRVNFLGWCSEDEVRQQLFRSRVFLLLSYKPGERLPNAVKEGMAAGCICISSPSPGIEELIEHGSDGFICDADDMAGIMKAVAFGFESDAAAQMSHAASQKIRTEFDVQVSAEKYTKCWNQLLIDASKPIASSTRAQIGD